MIIINYVHPKSGWVSYYIRDGQDIEAIVELFRFNYHRPWLKSESAGQVWVAV